MQDEKEQYDLLDAPNAPMATFAGRIRLAYLLGLLRKVEAHTLQALGALRNLFAHRVNISLADDFAAKHVRKLIGLARHPAGIKRAFAEAEKGDEGTRFVESLIRHLLVDYQLSLNSRRASVRPLLPATSHYFIGGMAEAEVAE